MLSWNEIRHRAIKFSREWKGTTSEKSERQTFWNEFFEIFGIRRRTVAAFEEPVRKLSGNWGYIDLFWPSRERRRLSIRPPSILTMISVILSLSLLLLSAKVSLLEPIPDNIQAILPPYVSDVGQNHEMSKEEETAWKAKVDAIPDVTNRLCELFWPLWDLEEEQLTPRIGKTLATRRDMNPTQLDHLARLIRDLEVDKMSGNNFNHWNSLLYGLQILANYPSPEHEDIALEILNSDVYDYRKFAIATIREIGSEKSIAYVRRLMEEEKQRPAALVPSENFRTWYDTLEDLERHLVQRERKRLRDSGAETSRENKTNGNHPEDTNNRLSAVDRTRSWGWVWAGLVALLVGFLLRHRLKSIFSLF